jgi:hypothetical protein
MMMLLLRQGLHAPCTGRCLLLLLLLLLQQCS